MILYTCAHFYFAYHPSLHEFEHAKHLKLGVTGEREETVGGGIADPRYGGAGKPLGDCDVYVSTWEGGESRVKDESVPEEWMCWVVMGGLRELKGVLWYPMKC